MKALLSCIVILLILGCSTPVERNQHTSEPLAVSGATPEQPKAKTSESKRKQLSINYNEFVMLSILELDDGTTSPEIIARSALSRAGKYYREWKRATVGEDLNLESQYKRDQFENALANFPTQSNIDMWTGFVLEFRNKGQKITPKGRQRLEELRAQS
jgi:hypothetical protein